MLIAIMRMQFANCSHRFYIRISILLKHRVKQKAGHKSEI